MVEKFDNRYEMEVWVAAFCLACKTYENLVGENSNRIDLLTNQAITVADEVLKKFKEKIK